MTVRWGDPAGRVYLRALVEQDFDQRYLEWFADPEVTRYLDARDITRADAIAHLEAGRDGRRWSMFAICRADDGAHIGNLKIGPVRWRDGVSDLVTVIGDRAAWGQGHARAAIAIGIDIAFREMNLRKLSASIVAANLSSIKAYVAAGFVEEARLKDQYALRHDGRTILEDKVYVACFNPRHVNRPAAASHT